MSRGTLTRFAGSGSWPGWLGVVAGFALVGLMLSVSLWGECVHHSTIWDANQLDRMTRKSQRKELVFWGFLA